MPRFAILMTEGDVAWSRLPREEQERLLARYAAYAKDLRSRGLLAEAAALGMPGRVLRPVRQGTETRIVEERCWPTEDLLTGYFLVEAPDLDAATEIARGCPALLHGETVTVRPVAGD